MSNRLWFGLVAATLFGQSPQSGCLLDRAVQLHQAGDWNGAIREYQKCIAAQPGRVEARSNLGAVLAKLGRYQDAIDQYQAALKLASPELAPRLRLNLGLAYYKSSRVREAAEEFEAVNRAQPGDLNAALLLADCRLRMGQFQSVIDILSPIEQAQPDQPALDYVLGMAFLRSGRIAEGQKRVDRILRRGESAEGRFLMGTALFSAGDYPGSVKEFARAAALNPDVPSLQSYYGRALLFTGDADGASAAFRKELASNPNDFDANFQLASILAHRGKDAEAKPLLERAVLVRPDSSEAREALAHGFDAKQAANDPGIAPGSPAPLVAGLDFGQLQKPVVLVFGSYTCPKLRGSASGLKRIAEEYRGRVEFRLVYIREAHAQGDPEGGWDSTVNNREGVSLAAPRSFAEKQDHAALCLRRLNLPFQAVTDDMDGTAERAYQAWPSRLYVIGANGRVVFHTRLGELDFHPAELDAAIRETLAGKGQNAGSR